MTTTGVKIAQISCGRDIFDIVLNNKYARCHLNSIDVLSSKELDSFAPIVGMLVLSACNVPEPEIGIKKKSPTYADFFKGFLDSVSKSDQVKVKVLEDKPDEIADQKPKQASINCNKLEEYRSNIKTFCDCASDVVYLSDVLLRTKLPKSVHAFKDIDRALTKVKATTEELSKDKDQRDAMVEQTGSRVGQVIVAMESSNIKDSNVKRVVQVCVDNIVSDFMYTKKLLSSVINSFYHLQDINTTFKKYTGYPATWFFDPSVYYNFSERYKDASDNLIDAVRTESSVIRPLFIWKMKVTGE